MFREISIYTDGACSGNPGPGGWGAVLLYERDGIVHTKQISGYEKDTTNNRMELTAVIQGISAVNEPCNICIHSDSAYVINAFNLDWISNWRKRKFKGVKNADLWRALDVIIRYHNYIKWIHVKGHSGIYYNEVCDKLATNEIKRRKGE